MAVPTVNLIVKLNAIDLIELNIVKLRKYEKLLVWQDGTFFDHL